MFNQKNAIIVATWVGIIVNILLAVLKGVGGLIAGSKALLADALHSASDVAGSVVVLFAVKIAHKPPDKEHPYGHGKAENIASIIVSLLLIIVGIEISISSVKIFFGEAPVAPGKLAFIILVVSILIKEVLFHYKNRLGKKFNSPALISEAWHHRSDAISSFAALIGVGTSLLGHYFQLSFLLYGDAVAGIIVSIIVIRVGYQLARDSFNVVLEQVLSPEDAEPYKSTVLEVEGVERIDELYARNHGSYVIIDIKISVNPEITVKHGHDIARNVKDLLIHQHIEVEDVFVHVNPFDDTK
ncbi:MAG TPA: cation diffusion facilitator family transporter [Pseudogracilibacillus sp.]|nr:cation diffusion facilitator family transporter [Pseudogracilibacillus sp.]